MELKCHLTHEKSAAILNEMELEFHLTHEKSAAILDEMEIEFHLTHDNSREQYCFDNTWHCMYTFVLLMMGKGTAWNM